MKKNVFAKFGLQWGLDFILRDCNIYDKHKMGHFVCKYIEFVCEQTTIYILYLKTIKGKRTNKLFKHKIKIYCIKNSVIWVILKLCQLLLPVRQKS